MSRLMTKPTKWHVRPAKTQISLGYMMRLNYGNGVVQRDNGLTEEKKDRFVFPVCLERQ